MGGRDDGEVEDDQAYFLRGEWSPRQLESFNRAWEADMERYADFLKKLADELAESIEKRRQQADKVV